MLPKEPLPYAQRLRNRIIALGIFATLCFMIGSCIFGGGKKQEVAQLPEAPEAPVVSVDSASNTASTPTTASAATDSGALDLETAMAEGTPLSTTEQKTEDLANTQAAITAAVTPEVPPEI